MTNWYPGIDTDKWKAEVTQLRADLAAALAEVERLKAWLRKISGGVLSDGAKLRRVWAGQALLGWIAPEIGTGAGVPSPEAGFDSHHPSTLSADNARLREALRKVALHVENLDDIGRDVLIFKDSDLGNQLREEARRATNVIDAALGPAAGKETP